MAGAVFKLTGDKALIAKLKGYAQENPKVVGAALYQEGNEIMGESRENYVPYDLGTLRDSGNVENPEYAPGKITVKLGFGGAAEAYAAAIHEHPSAASPPSWSRGVSFKKGGPKYLELPVLAAAPGFGKRIADRIRRMF